VDALGGRWSGTYRVPGGARRGTVRFELRPGADTAFGEVEMSFSPSVRLYGDETREELARRPCTVIDIAVVRVDARTIRGTLSPYWDPDCDCRAMTVFEGRLSGNRIVGSFTSRREGQDSVALRGGWTAERE
jgi:hypothetical protein